MRGIRLMLIVTKAANASSYDFSIQVTLCLEIIVDGLTGTEIICEIVQNTSNYKLFKSKPYSTNIRLTASISDKMKVSISPTV